MAITLENGARSAMCDALVDLLDVGSETAQMKITTSGDTVLSEHNLNNPAFGAASNRVATANKKMICRVDFERPLEILKSGMQPDIYELVKSRFPIVETKELIGNELFVGIYYGKDREKIFKLSTTFILIEYTKCEYFGKLKEDFLSSVDVIFKKFPKTRIKRMGLRCIYSIELDGDPFDWKDHLDKKLTYNIDIASDKSKLSRVFNVIEFNYGDALLKFQYGLFNDDYPAQIKKKAFLLDYDISTAEILEKEYLDEKLDNFHIKLCSCFEEAITDSFRNIMTNACQYVRSHNICSPISEIHYCVKKL